MLVLTRKPGEQIVIGNAIRITVVSVGHGRVKIGVEAPANVSIDRQEVFDRKAREAAGDADAVELTPPREDVASPTAVLRDTAILHNRISDRLPGGEPAAANGADRPAIVTPRRTPDPRKPR